MEYVFEGCTPKLACGGSNYRETVIGAYRKGQNYWELIERASTDLTNSSHAICLTGAGMPPEYGIPDFRGPNGIWTKNPHAEMKAYEAYDQFRVNPKGYWEEK